MTGSLDFKARLEAKVSEQLRAQRVGYLFGAGSSYLNGAGYRRGSKLGAAFLMAGARQRGFGRTRGSVGEASPDGDTGVVQKGAILGDTFSSRAARIC